MQADTRVLTRLHASDRHYDSAAPTKLGLYVDCETTGIGPDARLIEFAAVSFSYDEQGRVGGVIFACGGFNDPGIPIPPEITEITGICDADVAGQRVAWSDVASAFVTADLIVAHNAAFDRPVIERHFPQLADLTYTPHGPLRWACSYREVPWKRFGCACSKLRHILIDACDTFYDAHRADDDCYAGIHALATAHADGQSAMKFLIDSAAKPTVRVWALGAPFATKDALKQRGYRWNDGEDGRPKAWYLDTANGDDLLEQVWLRDHAGVTRPRLQRFTAHTRYREDGR